MPINIKNLLSSESSGYAEGTEYLENNQGAILSIFHLPSQASVSFKAMLTDFSDNYNQKWNSQQAYGRMDEIQQYAGTTREINISWVVPAASVKEAAENTAKISRLASFQYPGYETLDSLATTISTPPLIRVSYGNLINRGTRQHDDNSGRHGLLCRIDGINPSFDPGFGMINPKRGVFFPKIWNLSMNLTVIHEHAMGWAKSNWGTRVMRQNMKNYPYGIGSFSDVSMDALKIGAAVGAALGTADSQGTANLGATTPEEVDEERPELAAAQKMVALSGEYLGDP